MTEILRLFNLYTTQEALYLAILGLAILIANIFYIRYLSKDKVVSIMAVASFVVYLAIYAAVYTLLTNAVETVSNGLMQIALFLGMIAGQTNITVIALDYFDEKKLKRFDPDHITRKHFQASLKSGIFLLMTGLVFTPFVPIKLALTIVTAILSILLILVFNHLIARYFIRENGSRA